MLLSVLCSFGLPSTPVSAASTTYQAETATIFHGVVATNHTGYTGTGFVDYNNEAGSYIEWSVSVAQAASAKLTFRFANGATVNRPLEIRVNGSLVSSNLAFNPTGSWDTWTTQSISAPLQVQPDSSASGGAAIQVAAGSNSTAAPPTSGSARYAVRSIRPGRTRSGGG